MQSSMQSTIQKGLSEISLYPGEIATRAETAKETKKLLAVFPDVSPDFIIVLADRLIENKFTEDRVKDAINHVIDTCPYRRPAMSDIISFDKKMRLFTFEEIKTKCRPDFKAFEHFEKIEIDGKKRFIEI